MIDVHDKLESFGVWPKILGIPTYSLLVGLGILLGGLYLVRSRQNKMKPSELSNGSSTAESDGSIRPVPSGQVDPVWLIIAAALVFGTLGSKIPTLLSKPTLQDMIINKSIVGGLLGGLLGVIIVKRLFKIKLKLGNQIAPAAALGLGIGRLGCFFNGCCYGIPAKWGIDFGDGQLRLPTQLMESAFHFTAFFLLHHFRNKVRTPGILFKIYAGSYFIFRFFIEFIRANPIYWQGLTLYQLLCLAGTVWMALLLLRQKLVRPAHEREENHGTTR